MNIQLCVAFMIRVGRHHHQPIFQANSAPDPWRGLTNCYSSGAPGSPGQDAVNGNGNPRFLSSDVGFFDPFYEGKSSDGAAGMEHAGNETYFRDILVFIDRIKDVARVKGAEWVTSNLRICLRGEALEWYTCQLPDGEKRLLIYGNGVDEWSSALLETFEPTKASGMATIVKERYTLAESARDCCNDGHRFSH